MAKKVYRWRYPLDASRLDISLAFKSSSGVGIRPVPIRLVLAVLVSGFVCLWIVQASPLMSMGIGWAVLFVLVWIIASVVLLRPDKSGHLAFEQLPVLLSYIPKSSRMVLTRSDCSAWGALSCIGIEDIDPETGLITFHDGDVGFLYRVVGSGSVLLFESDQEAIVNRVDAFWRKMKTEYEITFITTREPQKVGRQVKAMNRRIDAMGVNPELDELRKLAESQRDVLQYRIGTEYRSLHQYMLIKAGSFESLMQGKNMLVAETEGSSYMFKRVQALYDTEYDESNPNKIIETWDLTDVFKSIFGPLPHRTRLERKRDADEREARKGVRHYGSSR